MAQQQPAQDAWARARDRFVEDLSEAEKQMYYKGSLEMIYYDASVAKNRHENTSKSKHLVDKLQPLVSAIDQYAEALDVYSNAYPLALSPLWGSLRIVLHLAREFGKYFEKLLDMFEQIGQVIPRFRAYEQLFPNNERLVHLISIVYVDILAFCSDVKTQFRHGKRAAKTNLSILLKLTWKPIDLQFANYMRKFKDHERTVEKEAKVAEMIESAESRALVQANRLQLEKERQENERQAMLSKLCMVSSKEFHLKQRQICYEGTGKWALQNSTYLNWKAKTGHRALCCYGIPGCGKSVLASTIVEDLRCHEDSAHHVIYYYCSHADARSTDTTQILGGFLKQLILDGILSSASQEELLTILRKDEDHDRKERLAKLVRSAVLSHPVAFLVLDGLDECKSETQKFIINFLDKIIKKEDSKISILVTCRDESQTLSVVQHWPSILLSETAINDDLRRFVSFSVRSSIEKGDLNISDAPLEEEIISVLTLKAHGMFLWVHFQLIELCTTIAPSQIRAALQGLPNGLGDTYERILTRINSSDLHWNIATRIFNWLACARRPLKLEEMQEAVAFDSSDKAWDADKIPKRNSLLKICQGLVVQGPDNGIVQFAHYTVQQYLFTHDTPSSDISEKSTRRAGSHYHCLSMGVAQDDAADLCITYLNFSDFETAITPHVQDTRFAQNSILGPGGPGAIAGSLGLGKPVFNAIYRVMGRSSRPVALDIDYAKYLNLKPGKTVTPQDDKHKFLGYILENWAWHFRRNARIPASQFEDLLIKKIMPFEFRPWGSNRHFGPYGCSFCSTDLTHGVPAKELILTSMMHWAAAEGNSGLLACLLQFDHPQFTAPKSISIHLHLRHEIYSKETMILACRMGHTNVMKTLLDYFPHLCWDSSLLLVAASAGHTETLVALRQHNVEEFNNHLEVLLFKAATNGHVSVVQYLLTFVVNLEFRDDFTEMTALQSAITNCREEVIGLLAQAGYDVDEHDSSGATALHHSVRRGDLSMTTCLVEAGASINSTDGEFRTPIVSAILASHSGITDYLLAHPLCRNSFVSLELLDDVHGLEIDWGRVAIRPRLWAAAFGSRNFFIAVLDQIDAEKIGDKYDVGAGVNLLHVAARYGNISAIAELLRRGLSPDTSTNKLCTPLHIAAYWGITETVKELLRRRAQPNCVTVHGWTPLHFAAKMRNEVCIEVLCRHGADVNASTNVEQGAMTPLHLLVLGSENLSFRSIIMTLMENGVELKKCNREGETAFEMADSEGWQDEDFLGLLEIEAETIDRPYLWHLRSYIYNILRNVNFGPEANTFGLAVSEVISHGKFNDYDVTYAKILLRRAREFKEIIAKKGADSLRCRSLELIIFLLQQAIASGTTGFKVIPSSDSESPIMGQPPNTPVEEKETITDPYPPTGSFESSSFGRPRRAPAPSVASQVTRRLDPRLEHFTQPSLF